MLENVENNAEHEDEQSELLCISPSITDMVNHPKHYQTKNGLEVIDIIEAVTEDLTGIEAVCLGNCIKYLARYKKKNGLEDLNKAQWYLNKLISIETENETKRKRRKKR